MIWFILKTGHPCCRAWKMKRRPLRTRQTWKTPERSKTTLGVKGEQVRSPHPRSPFVNWCPQRWGPSALLRDPCQRGLHPTGVGPHRRCGGLLLSRGRRGGPLLQCTVRYGPRRLFSAPEPHAQLLVVRVQPVVDQTSCGFLCLSCPPLTLRAGSFLLLME